MRRLLLLQLAVLVVSVSSFSLQNGQRRVTRTRSPTAATWIRTRKTRTTWRLPAQPNPNDQLPVQTKQQQDTIHDDNNNNDWAVKLVLPLWLLYISNQWSRSAIYYVVDFSTTATSYNSMNVELNFNESQYAILASIAFTALFAVGSVLFGFVVDQPGNNRKVWSIVACLVWSLTTLSTSLVPAIQYETVLVGRVVLGLACAVTTPAAYTWIRDSVPAENSATASSLYGTGVALGSGLASLTILLDSQLGWRSAYQVIGVAGLVAALVALVVLPDDMAKQDGTAPQEMTLDNFRVGVQEALSVQRAQLIYLASFLRFGSGLCIGVWSAPYFRLVLNGDDIANYAIAQACISAVLASLSGVIGGRLADRLVENNEDPGERLLVPVVGSILAAPAWFFAIQTASAPEDTFAIAMSWLALEYLVAECWFGPTIATLQSTVSKSVGGTAQGIFTLTGAVANLAPTAVGYLYSQANEGDLGSLLTAGVCFGYISSAVVFALAMRIGSDNEQ